MAIYVWPQKTQKHTERISQKAFLLYRFFSEKICAILWLKKYSAYLHDAKVSLKRHENDIFRAGNFLMISVVL